MMVTVSLKQATKDMLSDLKDNALEYPHAQLHVSQYEQNQYPAIIWIPIICAGKKYYKDKIQQSGKLIIKLSNPKSIKKVLSWVAYL